MQKIIGREHELKVLKSLYTSENAQFLAIYGRRRVGKTFLISQYFKDKGIYLEITGLRNTDTKNQLLTFEDELCDVFGDNAVEQKINTWFDAFKILRKQIVKISLSQKIILFFDEVPWLSTPKSSFLSALDHLWNRYLSRMDNVILIVCGSAASWMIKNIIDDKGGLHGRVTKEIRLKPFTLSETKLFLLKKNILLENKQVVELYMALGGVAKYLTHIERGKSPAQNINNICFNKNGPLFNEFRRLYRSLFNNYENHISIIKNLANTFNGITKNELLKKIGLKSGGNSTNIFRELEESGFIAKHPDIKKNKNNVKYKLIDEYSLFYLKWIENFTENSYTDIDTGYWLKEITSQQWYTWAGYVFENICFKHIANIKKALGIESVRSYEYSWFYKPSSSSSEKGAQVDMVIERADNCINMCEIKFCNSEFIINKELSKKLREKKATFQKLFSPKKSIFTTFISTYGVVENKYYHESVDNQITIDDLL